MGTIPRRITAGTAIARLSTIDLTDSFNQAMLAIDQPSNPNRDTAHNQTDAPVHDVRLKLLEAKGFKFDNHELTDEQFSRLTEPLWKWQEIFCTNIEQLPLSNLQPYKIEFEDANPIRQRLFPLTPGQERIMQKIADQMVRAKIIEPANSPYNHPAILVRKTNFNKADPDNIDQYRLVVDMRRLNASH